MVDILELCLLKEGENTTDSILLQCALWEMQNRHNVDSSARSDDGVDNPARTFMLIMFSSIVFFMQTGFAMVCAGAVRKKNVQNTMLKNLLDACVASIAFFTVGYAFAFGGTDENSPIKTFMGTKNFFLIDVTDLAFGFFQFAFSAASATIVAGSLAERCHMIAYLGYTVLLTGWVYPIVVHALWDSQGLLSANNVEPLFGVGMIDYAGSAVVHVTGGTAALIATTILGPRRER